MDQKTLNSSGTCPVAREPDAPQRLFCFPYAGAGGAAFADWPQFFPHSVQLIGLTLPGREARFTEASLDSVAAVAEDLGQCIATQTDVPFVFFGHSLGGIVAFETARWLRRNRLREPLLVIISGAPAPHCRRRRKDIHHLPDVLFFRELKRLNGTPSEILENAELMTLLLPAIRADFRAFERYTAAEEPPLSCAMAVFAGRADPDASEQDMTGWRQYTSGAFESFLFPGDHFFIRSARSEVLRAVFHCLTSARAVDEVVQRDSCLA